MTIREIIHEVAETLGEVPYLSGVPVIEDEKGSPVTKVQTEIGKKKVAVVVGWNGAEPVKQSDTVIIGDFNVVVSIFENPSVNRSKTENPTIGEMALAITKALTYAQAEGMDCPLFWKRITHIYELGEQGGGTVTCDVVFNTKAEL